MEHSDTIPRPPPGTAAAAPPHPGGDAAPPTAPATPPATTARPYPWTPLDRAVPLADTAGERPATSPCFGTWLNRPRRVLLTLAAVWIIGAFDFAFTLLEFDSGGFVELNPLARRVLEQPDHVVAAFKFGLLGVGTVILLALRRHAVAECACWLLLAIKVYVAVRWFAYYDCVLHGYENPLITVTLN